MQKRILIILFSIFISSFSLSQNKDALRLKNYSEIKTKYNSISIVTDDTLNIEPNLKKANIMIGIQVGSHSSNLTNNSFADFNRDIFLELYISFNLSDEVHSVIAFNYWEAQTNEISMPDMLISSETIISKALKLELDFSLFKIYSASLLLGPSISIDNITRATNAVFSLGANLKLKLPLPLWDEKVNLLATVNYQNGSEFLNFGGGINYSFISYLIGIEIGF